ncbi:MAG: hypothetical protein O2941_04715, partial [Cyanobacteria bacterium]|nr:hypothetical protein [Cyanobacteriota bacterium]
SCREGEIRPIKPQIPQKLFIPSKSQAWTLFEGSLPRGSLGLQSMDPPQHDVALEVNVGKKRNQ